MPEVRRFGVKPFSWGPPRHDPYQSWHKLAKADNSFIYLSARYNLHGD